VKDYGSELHGKQLSNEFDIYNVQIKNKEMQLLDVVCRHYNIDARTISNLITLEQSMVGKTRRIGIMREIDRVVEESLNITEEGGESAS
jgi:hypothetical protein